MKPVILLAEDDHNIRECVKDLLESEGYEVHAAANGKEAWDQLEQGSLTPDILLTDIMMPIMDGFELLERVTTLERLSGMSIIAFTASTTIRQRLSGIVPSLCIVAKPFDLGLMLDTIEKCSNNKESV